MNNDLSTPNYSLDSGLSVGTIFESAFDSVYDILKDRKKKLPYDVQRDMEAFSFLYSVAMYFLAQLQEPSRGKSVSELNTYIKREYPLFVNPFFERRVDFYCNFIGNKVPLARWFTDEIPDVPELKMYLAFGDIICDPGLRLDYNKAAISAISFLSQLEALKALNSMQETYLLYCRRLRSLH